MAESNISHSTNTDNRHYLIPAEIVRVLVTMGHHKAQLPAWKTFVGSLYAGAYVVFGGMVALTAGGGLSPAVSAANPAYSKLLIGLTFWIALILIITYGGELFTGNLMYLSLARLDGKITTIQVFKNWLIVFVGNYISCGFFAYILG
jgi:formate/nitrite transporter FocA (FNT family)